MADTCANAEPRYEADDSPRLRYAAPFVLSN